MEITKTTDGHHFIICNDEELRLIGVVIGKATLGNVKQETNHIKAVESLSSNHIGSALYWQIVQALPKEMVVKRNDSSDIVFFEKAIKDYGNSQAE